MKINIAVFMTIIYHALGALFILCTPFDLSSVVEGFDGGKMHHPSLLHPVRIYYCTIPNCCLASENQTIMPPQGPGLPYTSTPKFADSWALAGCGRASFYISVAGHFNRSRTRIAFQKTGLWPQAPPRLRAIVNEIHPNAPRSRHSSSAAFSRRPEVPSRTSRGKAVLLHPLARDRDLRVVRRHRPRASPTCKSSRPGRATVRIRHLPHRPDDALEPAVLRRGGEVERLVCDAFARQLRGMTGREKGQFGGGSADPLAGPESVEIR
jgi:hypothetical protein